ncbi:MAG TPA: YbaY family lipoprotein [Rubrivivax sp.]|nr:YbaY family lipoprotein [Rubrivivax sp.]
MTPERRSIGLHAWAAALLRAAAGAALAAMAAMALAGCTMPPPAVVLIEGRLDGPAAAALGAQAEWVVELRDDTADRVLGEQRGRVAAQSPPIAFELSVDAARIDAAHRLSVRGAVRLRGQVQWLTEPRPITAAGARIDVGSLHLQPHVSPGGFASTLDCGGRRLTVGYLGDRLRLSDGPAVYDLAPVRGSRPPRFERAGDPATFVELDESAATVSLQGQLLARCAAAAAASSR